MSVRCSMRFVHALALGLSLTACGGDDNKSATPVDNDNEGGAPAYPPSYPPALSPSDCVSSVSDLSLSQPEGAGVWGGLVVLEFKAPGDKLDSFEVQAYDPALGAWTSYYVSVMTLGQRDDGSYFLAVSPYVSEASKDSELKLRVRPSQTGCPDAVWTESEGFTTAEPLSGTTWTAEIPSASLSGQVSLQRNEIPGGATLPSTPVKVGDSTLKVEFGKKGAFTETFTVPLATETDAAWDGCTLVLTFSGTYSLKLRQQYGGITLAVSDLVLSGYDSTTCDLPALEEVLFTTEEATTTLPAISQQVSVNYLPTLYTSPDKPVWQNSSFGQFFQHLPQLLSYQTKTESGYGSGYIYPQDLTLVRD